MTADIEALKSVAKRNKWKLSPVKRAFHAEGVSQVGAAVPPLRTLGQAKINIVAAYAIAAGEGRFAMLFWVEPRDYNRAAKQLGAV